MEKAEHFAASVGWENIVLPSIQLEKNRWMEGRNCRGG